MNPTGSSDAYGLRRNSIGIIRIAEGLDRNIDLIEILNFSLTKVEESGGKVVNEENKSRLIEFFNERIRNYFVENGFNNAIVNSLINNEFQVRDVKSILQKAMVLRKYEGKSELMSAIEIFKRLRNITRENSRVDIEKTLLKDNFELSLYDNLKRLEDSLSFESIAESPEMSLKQILDTAPSLSKFFDNVLVMDKNEELKQNRLNLLTRMKNVISGFANFSEI